MHFSFPYACYIPCSSNPLDFIVMIIFCEEYKLWSFSLCILFSVLRFILCSQIPSVGVLSLGARGSVVGWGTMLQAGRSPVRVPDEVDFSKLPILSCRNIVLGSTQPLTEMSIRNFPAGKGGRHVGLTTLPPSVNRMSENVGASTSQSPKGLLGLYRDSFTFTYSFLNVRD
jgi:hypothetical protein